MGGEDVVKTNYKQKISKRKMRRLELTDLFPYYPDQDTPDISGILDTYEEFIQLKEDTDKLTISNQDYFSSQKIVRRLIRYFPVLLLFHDTGTGKTCASSWPADEALRDPESGINGVIVLTKNTTLESEYRRELAEKCTQGRYITERVREAQTTELRNRRIKRELESSGYEFYTFERFANLVEKMSDLEISRRFSRKFFIMDEMHLLRVNPNKIGEEVTGEENRTNLRTIGQIERVFKLAEWIKLIGMTATPMINSVNDIGTIYNLALLAAKREPFPNDTDFATITAEQLEDRLRGMISVVRSLDTGVDVVSDFEGAEYIEDRVNGIDVGTWIYPSVMTGQQVIGYLTSLNNRTAVYQNERQASIAVMPDGTFGKSNFSRFVDNPDKNARPNSQLRSVLGNEEALHDHMVKLWRILMIELAQLQAYQRQERTVEGLPGKAWIYSDYTWVPVLLGMILKEYGFEEYTGSSSIVVQTPLGKVPAPRLEKRPRFALITGQQTRNQIDNIKDLYNTPQNLDGEYLQIIIGSPKARVGINLLETIRIHAIGPSWNEAVANQSKGRAIRELGNQLGLRRLRERTGNPKARLTIHLYQHAARLEPDIDEFEVDVYVYLLSKSKEIPIREMRIKYSSISVDCHINYNRNTDGSGPEGQAVRYRCFDPVPPGYSDTNFIALYSDPDINRYITMWKNIFLRYFVFERNQPFQDIFRLSSDDQTFSPILVSMALAKMIDEKIPITDRFGYRAYVQQKGNQIFTQRNYPSDKIDSTTTYYSERIFGRVQFKLQDIINNIENSYQSDRLSELRKFNVNTDIGYAQLQETLLSMDLSGRADILESVVSDYVTKVSRECSIFLSNDLSGCSKRFEFDEAVLSVMEPFVFWTYDPQTIITQVQDEGKKSRRGRPTKSGNLSTQQKNYLRSIELPTSGNIIYFHTIYAHPPKTTKYGSIAKKFNFVGPIRLLTVSQSGEGGGKIVNNWRQANDIEVKVYQEIYRRELRSRLEPYEDEFNSFFGIRDSSTGEFIIRDRQLENPEAVEDRRKIRTGRSCRDWNIPDLISMMSRLGVPPPKLSKADQQIVDETSVDDKREVLQDEGIDVSRMSDSEVTYQYSWYLSQDKGKESICQNIESIMSSQNRIIRL